ncbi:hypothetical protein DPMN_073109 [Dreissena polymorpha]|uniref:Uncharacterized protein n=1 Tax=Dreissena polymorpha TaxID=45954 RepID=A0A9D4BYJ6_DREPO|nr:hypothetical protein DPMN_073109 [Dreissena polymorpha]
MTGTNGSRVLFFSGALSGLPDGRDDSVRKHSERISRRDAHQTALPPGFYRRSGTLTQRTSQSKCEPPAPGCNGLTLLTGRVSSRYTPWTLHPWSLHPLSLDVTPPKILIR